MIHSFNHSFARLPFSFSSSLFSFSLSSSFSPSSIEMPFGLLILPFLPAPGHEVEEESEWIHFTFHINIIMKMENKMRKKERKRKKETGIVITIKMAKRARWNGDEKKENRKKVFGSHGRKWMKSDHHLTHKSIKISFIPKRERERERERMKWQV